MAIIKEPGNTLNAFTEYSEDWQNRICDLAIEALSDVMECDEAIVYVKWQDFPPYGVLPFLYILFRTKTSAWYFQHAARLARATAVVRERGVNQVVGALEKMPRLHIDPEGILRPTHAILLASLPSKEIMKDSKLKSVIRKGVEDFLREYEIKKG